MECGGSDAAFSSAAGELHEHDGAPAKAVALPPHSIKRSRGDAEPSVESGLVGFRVSEVPEPVTIVMLALAGVGILGRRRR